MLGNDPGANPQITALDEEGFADITSAHIVESFARNFMAIVDAWRERGFGAVAKSYFDYLPREQGLSRDIGDNGDLLLYRAAGGVERAALLPRLAAPSWYDPESKGPRA
jgi:hypothetical protein